MKILKQKAGVSMIIALVLMIVFLTIGAGVMTAATTSATNATKIQDGRKCYYYALCGMDVTGKAITEGGLGALILSDIAALPGGTQLPYTLTYKVKNSDLPNPYKDGDDYLNMTVTVTVNDYAASPRVVIKSMQVDIRCGYYKSEYVMSAEFQYNGTGGTNGWTFKKYL